MNFITTGGMYGGLSHDEERDEIILSGHEPHHLSVRLSVPRQVLLDWLDQQGLIDKEPERYRRLYDEMCRQMGNLYDYADEHGIELPDPGPPFT